jgi:hypothetical protein
MSDREAFEKWLQREMPAGTVISDPLWWAPKILKAAQAQAQVRFVAACSGLQYENPMACGEISTVIVGDKRFDLPQPAQVNQQLLGALFDAAYCLDEAAEFIADWGAYASDYFREKHDLKADIATCKNRATSLRAAIAAAQEQGR